MGTSKLDPDPVVQLYISLQEKFLWSENFSLSTAKVRFYGYTFTLPLYSGGKVGANANALDLT